MHATFSNIESQDINFAKHSIVPECVNWEQELMRKLLNDKERERYEIEFNMEGLVRGDLQSRYQAYAIGINGVSWHLMILGLKRIWASWIVAIIHIHHLI